MHFSFLLTKGYQCELTLLNDSKFPLYTYGVCCKKLIINIQNLESSKSLLAIVFVRCLIILYRMASRKKSRTTCLTIQDKIQTRYSQIYLFISTISLRHIDLSNFRIFIESE